MKPQSSGCGAPTRRLVTIAALATFVSLLLAGPAAAAPSPWWHLGAITRPTDLKPESIAQVVFTTANVGDAATTGAGDPVQIAVTLPPELKELTLEAVSGKAGNFGSTAGPVSCSAEAKPLITCSFADNLPSYDQIEVRIGVQVGAGVSSTEEVKASVSGGGAPPASISRPLASGESTPFGFSTYELGVEEEGGGPTTQAGSHDFQLTTTLVANQRLAVKNTNGVIEVLPAGLVKDLNVELPPGLLGNPSPFPRCTLPQFFGDPAGNETLCPPQTVLGVAMVTINEPSLGGIVSLTAPIVNLEPALGEPARFGFLLPVTPVFIDTAVRSDGDYGVTAASLSTSQTASFLNANVVFWGTPGDPRHDPARGSGCLSEARGEPHSLPCVPLEQAQPPAFQTLPTSCAGPPISNVEVNSWADPANPLLVPLSRPLAAFDGCNRIPFGPTIHSEPTSNAATSPTGLNFDINVNDEGLENSKGLAQSQIRKTVVALPEGFTANPSVAEGLKACSEAEYKASSLAAGTGCTEESKVGDVEIESPLVKQVVRGSLFVARQGENPNHNLLTLYMVAKNPELGVMVKQALKVTPNPVTGQLTTEADEIPQLPFSRFHLSFRSGQRSPLITPPACGPYTVKADLYPWSEPAVPVHDESSFKITQGPEGQPCPLGGLPPFHPELLAGTINNRAGSFSPFDTRITRHDSEQEITHFSIKLPPGVIGKLAGLASCSDAQIAAAEAREHEGGGAEEEAAPSCPASSEIGRSLAGSGVGNVLAYAPGKLYLAGPYHGSNLSLVAITAAKVGPFDLGTVVVRFALRINPETAEVFVDATGSDPIPHIVDGIPVHLRDVRAYVDRPEFVLNPTDCTPTSTASTVLGSGLDFASEADDNPITITSRFQAADCAALPFKPQLTMRLIGGTNRGAHPALRSHLAMNGVGEAGIGFAEVILPHSEFIENAHFRNLCTRVQFNSGAGNGAGCPAGSIYGHAKAVTPLLSEPLEGPVMLRSNPERKLPDVVAALHNSQVDFDLVGNVDGLPNGELRTTFANAPDAPVTSFDLELDGRSKGLFVNSANLCAHKHKAIANFTGQNGKVYDTKPVMRVKCPKGRKGKGGKHKRRKRQGAHR